MIILSHRDLICQLYKHIEVQAQELSRLEHTISLLKDTLTTNSIPLPEAMPKTPAAVAVENTNSFRLAKLIASFAEGSSQDTGSQGEYEEFCKRTLPLLSQRIVPKSIRLKRVNMSRPRTKYNSEDKRNLSHYVESKSSKEQRDHSNLRGRVTSYNNKLGNYSPDHQRQIKLAAPAQSIANIRNNMDKLLQSGDLLNSIIVLFHMHL